MECDAMSKEDQMEKIRSLKNEIDNELDDKLAIVQNLVIDCIYNSPVSDKYDPENSFPIELYSRRAENIGTIKSSPNLTKKKKNKNKRRKRKGKPRTKTLADKRARVVLEPRGYPLIIKAIKNKWKEEKTDFDMTPIECLSLDDILNIFPEVMYIYMEKSLFNNTVHDKLMEDVDFEPFRKLVMSNKVLEECAIVNMCKNYLFAAQLMYQFCKERYRKLIHIKAQIKDIAKYQKIIPRKTRSSELTQKSAIELSEDCKSATDEAWEEIETDIDIMQKEVFKLIAVWLDQMEEEFLTNAKECDDNTFDEAEQKGEGKEGKEIPAILPLRFLPSLDIYQKTIIPMLHDILEYRREGQHLLDKGQDSEDD
jgi:hypothetical protein